ncbi:hypothetical protein CMI39_02350 [Candidatus Pacearchaeota archaeon]|jgi:hypothetical protein|nr:hypothetical protein [Candidatus Pacearchaeota archaeon]|tara:strand:+ start:7715 stop:8248 length:534 start_codon:yes stop_codon:yes gene_type:complete
MFLENMGIKDIIIGIAIIILTISVVVYGVNTFYNKPEYTDFCEEFKTQEIIETQERCEEINGKWTSQDIRCVTTPCPKGYCDRDYECRKDYEDSREKYSKNVLIISIPLGILIIVLGAYFFRLDSVGAGLMGGGVGTLLYGAGGYWRYAGDIFRFILSLVGLVALIWFAHWFNKKKK